MKDAEFPLSDWLSDKEDIRFNLASSSIESLNFSDVGRIDSDIDLGSPEDELERKVESKVESIYESDVEAIITSGAQAANSIVFDTLLEEGDEVLVEDPAYNPLKMAPSLKGAEVNLFYRRYENDFKIDIEEIEEKISKDTKVIVTTNPHNPSGVFHDPTDLSELKDFLEDNDVYLLVDEIYRGFIESSGSLASLSDRVLVSSSFSKVFGFGGLRFGTLVSTDLDLLEKIRNVKKILAPHNPTVNLKMGLKVLESRERLLERSRDIAEKGRSLANGWVSGSGDLEWVEPSPGVISFPKLKIDCSAETFSKRAKEAGVLVTPGKYFSGREEFDDHIRLTFGKDFQQVVQGLQILSRVMDDCKG